MSQLPKQDEPKADEGSVKRQSLMDGIKTIGVPALLAILGLVIAVAWALPKGIELGMTKLGETQQSLGQLQQRV